MTILKLHSPAQVRFILDSGESALGDLLRVVFADLLLKQILNIHEKEKTYNEYRRDVNASYITLGPKFESYLPMVSVQPFLIPFNGNKNLKIKFKYYVRKVFNEAYVNSDYKTNFINQQDIKPYFKQGYFQKLFNKHPLTDQGIRIQSEIQAHLNHLENTINSNLKIHSKMMPTLLEIGGHFFLLNQLDINWIKESILKQNNAAEIIRIERIENIIDFVIAFSLLSSEFGHSSKNFTGYFTC